MCVCVREILRFPREGGGRGGEGGGEGMGEGGEGALETGVLMRGRREGCPLKNNGVFTPYSKIALVSCKSLLTAFASGQCTNEIILNE